MILNPPTVSIITPAYNCGKTIAATLASVVGQTFENWEHIIVDDASRDDTLNLIKSHCVQNHRARWIGLDRNQGAAVARNIAIQAAKGRYIAFLDSDDVWLPHKLERQLGFMQLHNVAFSYTAYEIIDEKDTLLGVTEVPVRQCYTDLLKNNRIGCLTAMYDTEILGKVLMPVISMPEDLGLWLRLLRKIPYAYGMPEVLSRYRVRGGSVSSNKFKAARHTWLLYKKVERLPTIKAFYYFSRYAANGIRSNYLIKVGKLKR